MGGHIFPATVSQFDEILSFCIGMRPITAELPLRAFTFTTPRREVQFDCDHKKGVAVVPWPGDFCSKQGKKKQNLENLFPVLRVSPLVFIDRAAIRG